MIDTKEIWVKVIGYEGYYEISSYGRFKILSKYCDGKGGSKRLLPEKITFGHITSKGYLRVGLTVNKIEKSYMVHRLVALHFIPNVDSKPQINHIDGDKRNNNMNNLEWCTNRENTEHYYMGKKRGSQYTGVWVGTNGKFRSCITLNGKTIHLGTFVNEIDAAKAYSDYRLNVV